MTRRHPLGLFAATGIEVETMIVAADTLDVRPIADALLRDLAGGPASEWAAGPVMWSNELALHVIELKSNGPAERLDTLADAMQAALRDADARLAPLGARLLPGAMHPWMAPERDLRLWPHADRDIYDALHRIFDCRGHGWANLQSVQINLPFADDAEFGRLHAAIRLLLPIMPGLAAASPFVDGAASGRLDARLAVYRHNAHRVPSVTGAVVPEAVFSEADYERTVLQPIYDDLAPHDPDGVLRYEWVNARGAIAHFERGSIEIRVLDAQEGPRADLAVAALVVAVLRALVAERWLPLAGQQAWPGAPLAALLEATGVTAERTPVADADYLAAFGYPHGAPATVGDLWAHLIDATGLREADGGVWRAWLELYLAEGCLARRIAAAAGMAADAAPGTAVSPARLHEVYTRLADGLVAGRLFSGRA